MSDRWLDEYVDNDTLRGQLREIFPDSWEKVLEAGLTFTVSASDSLNEGDQVEQREAFLDMARLVGSPDVEMIEEVFRNNKPIYCY